MSNLTVAVDEAVVRAARSRAIAERTSVNARVRDFLADCGQGATTDWVPGRATLVAAEAQTAAPGARAAQRRGAKCSDPAPAAPAAPAWLAQVRERVNSFGGAEPADWLAPRDQVLPRHGV